MSTREQISEVVKAFVSTRYFSGSVLVKKGQENIFEGAFGYAHRGWKVNNTIDTKFDTASITKVFTAVGILQLIEQGKISLQDSIINALVLEDTTISDQVTVYHLLTHTSGIGDDADEEAGEDYEELFKDKPNYSLQETIDYLPQFVHKPAVFEPGKGCRYNNVAFVLLGLLIEKVTGMRYREYIQEYVFKPLGMTETGFFSKDGVEEEVAEGYAAIENSEEEIIGWRKNIYAYPSIGSPDAGAYTTVKDLDLFMRSLVSGKLLSAEMTKVILTPKELYRAQESTSEMMGFGLEFTINNETKEIVTIKKDGCNAGVACFMLYYPNTDISVVLLANQDCNVWALSREIEKIIK